VPLLALVIELLAAADQRRRDAFARDRLGEPVRPAVVPDEARPVDAAEVRRDQYVALLARDVLVVDLFFFPRARCA